MELELTDRPVSRGLGRDGARLSRQWVGRLRSQRVVVDSKAGIGMWPLTGSTRIVRCRAPVRIMGGGRVPNTGGGIHVCVLPSQPLLNGTNRTSANSATCVSCYRTGLRRARGGLHWWRCARTVGSFGVLWRVAATDRTHPLAAAEQGVLCLLVGVCPIE